MYRRQFTIPLPEPGPARDAVIDAVVGVAEAYPQDVAFTQALSVGVTDPDAAEALTHALVDVGLMQPA